VKVRSYLAALGFAALWICTTAAAADARAWLDRNSMHMGETVTLNVEVTDNAKASQPDFSALQNDFDLLGTQSSSSVNIVNGQTSSKLLWAVGLEPKHAGTLTIPALTVAGTQTQPISLTVQAALAGPSGNAGDDVFLEFEASPRAPYVQQEVRLTVKLYYATNLTDGNLEEPKADGLAIHKLGQDSNYAADVDGRRYRVLERHYAASAEKSGALDMPALVFRGRALDPGDVNSFFSRGREVGARSPAISLDVRARPPASGSDMWLPAQSLTLTADGIDANASVHAGEPLTLTLRLKAQGLGFEQLPELKLPNIDGADIYPDKETTQNRDDGPWIYGQRERKFAIVPSRAGTLTVPPLSVVWWDTEHDRAATAELPATTITVLPAAAGAATANSAPPVPASTPTPSPGSNAQSGSASPILAAPESVQLRLWRTVALGALILWALTVATGIVWWRTQRPRTDMALAASAASRRSDADEKEFRAACASGDLPAAARALLQWARREQPDVRNLGELARMVSDPKQSAGLQELERALYAQQAPAGIAPRLAVAFRSGPAFVSRSAKPGAKPAVPELYPFRI
jgi:hypothetical protein